MLRIDFEQPLTALEIRDPSVEVCALAAREFSLYANFRQPQQQAFGPVQTRGAQTPKRERIGNGKHKDWFIDFQPEPLGSNKPTIAGTLAIRSLICPAKMQFGGFDYGVYGESSPTYSFATFQTASETGLYRPVDPDPDMLEIIYRGLADRFKQGQERLFEVPTFTN